MGSLGAQRYGDALARDATARFVGVFADTTALAALPADKRPDAALAAVKNPPGVWLYDLTSTATAGGDVLAPAAGGGRWFATAGAGGAANRAKTVGVRGASDAALAAYTRTANVVLADANGSINPEDGLTLAIGDLYLLKDGAAGADNGVYVIDALGAAGAKFQLTRAPGYDTSAEVTDGDLIIVAEGTANADKIFRLTTNEAITLNTTGLTYREEIDAEMLASVASGEGASLIGLQDAGAFTTATTVEAAVAELYQDIVTAQASVPIELRALLDADGDPLAKFIDGAAPTFGFALADSEALCMRWNNDATPGTALGQISLPADLDSAANATLEFLCSKSGATLGDATTLTITAFLLAEGDLHDADADAGGTTTALVGDAAAKTTALLTLTIAAANIPAAARTMTFTLAPTAGLLGTDDFLLHEARLTYTRLLLTS